MSKILPLGKIQVNELVISVIQIDNKDYINLTEMLKDYSEDSIKNWMKNKDTLEFLGAWESLYNPDFRTVEFDRLRNEAGTNRFLMSVSKWKEATNAIGIFSKKGKYGAGTFAHKDIAFEFASWLSPIFKLYIIKEFDRLKTNEAIIQKIEWNTNRILSKVNHFIHTDSIKENLVLPKKLSPKDIGLVYASELDLLNIALFGLTAKEWELKNQKLLKTGNMRDFATTEQLVVLSNLESYNAELIKNGFKQAERLKILNKTAIEQMKSLLENKNIKSIKSLGENNNFLN
ncbi:KilA-N domain-containing protein [Candidatus Gracilibacteria bacterium]|nr:KilA-N domain-containing protein [Candidatus Gracilibacteria bacterium]